jgi:hypothetical protein
MLVELVILVIVEGFNSLVSVTVYEEAPHMIFVTVILPFALPTQLLLVVVNV